MKVVVVYMPGVACGRLIVTADGRDGGFFGGGAGLDDGDGPSGAGPLLVIDGGIDSGTTSGGMTFPGKPVPPRIFAPFSIEFPIVRAPQTPAIPTTTYGAASARMCSTMSNAIVATRSPTNFIAMGSISVAVLPRPGAQHQHEREVGGGGNDGGNHLQFDLSKALRCPALPTCAVPGSAKRRDAFSRAAIQGTPLERAVLFF